MPPKGWRKKREPVLVEKTAKLPEALKELKPEIEKEPEAVESAFPSFDEVRATMMDDEHRRGRPGPHGRVGNSGLHDAL